MESPKIDPRIYGISQRLTQFYPDVAMGSDSAVRIREVIGGSADDIDTGPDAAHWDAGLLDTRIGAIDTKALVDGFADMGIVCSVIAPNGSRLDDSSDDRERILQLARRADVVVLDWALGGSVNRLRGAEPPLTSQQLISDILESDKAFGGRVRMICVYTDNRDLHMVHEVVGQIAIDSFAGAKVNTEGWKVTVSDHLLIALVAKSSNKSSGAPVSSEANLAVHLVTEFREMSNGLMHSVVLAGLAAVRDGAHQILARFGRGLDAAFLSHRALVGADDGENFVLGLIGDELNSKLVNAGSGRAITPERVRLAVDRLIPETGGVRGMLFASDSTETVDVPRELARKVLIEGRRAARMEASEVAPATLTDAATFTITCSPRESLDEARIEAEQQDLEFAVLSTLARDPRLEGKASVPETLRLGVLLRPIADPVQFLLCVQPWCDSVRVLRPRRFPLLPLKLVAMESDSPFDLSIPDMEKIPAIHSVNSQGSHISDLEFSYFSADPETQTVLSRFDTGYDRWVFTGDDTRDAASPSRDFAWAGTLRLPIALRISSSLADHFSRIGLDESEFQRIRARERAPRSRVLTNSQVTDL